MDCFASFSWGNVDDWFNLQKEIREELVCFSAFWSGRESLLLIAKRSFLVRNVFVVYLVGFVSAHSVGRFL
jgi:hypothetical protein